ncbi:hypothetical protein DE171_005543 [Clostridium beijerinckii]|nr:hypothetical protein [Clostridium beijerinckii]
MKKLKLPKLIIYQFFLIGSVGGRSSQLAAEYKASGKWSELNNASVELNELLTYALDYRKLIYKIIEYINL